MAAGPGPYASDRPVALYKPDVEAVFEELVALRDPAEAMIQVAPGALHSGRYRRPHSRDRTCSRRGASTGGEVTALPAASESALVPSRSVAAKGSQRRVPSDIGDLWVCPLA